MRDTTRLATIDRPADRPAGSSLPLALRSLFARLTGEAGAPVSDMEASTGPTFQQRQAAVRGRLLRDEAHAAWRAAGGAECAPLDPALAVLEGEIARLQSALEQYGEALKTIRTYGGDPGQRAVATAALTATPMVLRAAAPVPGRARREQGA